IKGNPEIFFRSKKAKFCLPVLLHGPNQRGPSCGFYSVGHVMQYWYEKLKKTTEPLLEPLKARTHMDEPKNQPRDEQSRLTRKKEARGGTFTSLRQYGKFRHITAYGSVFNAENLVALARLEGVKGHQGQYNGHVITTTTPDDYIKKVKDLIAVEC